MVRIVKDTITKLHIYDEQGHEVMLIDVVEQYHYDSEEERSKHKLIMELKGFTDSGQVKENIGDMTNPVYMWFGSYFKYGNRHAIVTNMVVQGNNMPDIK